ncbi:hypothetical protein FRC08_010208 [Ceratobasidium sp. 394]|nr:hypothetical protein FRC08_010208 [Ceratobasidium sp. 394]
MQLEMCTWSRRPASSRAGKAQTKERRSCPTSPRSKFSDLNPLAPPTSRTSLPDVPLVKEKVDTLAVLGGLFSGDEWVGVSGDEVEARDAERGGEEVDHGIVPEGGGGSVATDDEVEEVEDAREGEDNEITPDRMLP